MQTTGNAAATDYWCAPCEAQGRKARGIRRHVIDDIAAAERLKDYLGVTVDVTSAVALCGAHLKFVADCVDRSAGPQAGTDPLGYTVPCPRCSQQAAPKRSLAQARRGLARHLSAAHSFGGVRARAVAKRWLPRRGYALTDRRSAPRVHPRGLVHRSRRVAVG